jgi:hypothetical protein
MGRPRCTPGVFPDSIWPRPEGKEEDMYGLTQDVLDHFTVEDGVIGKPAMTCIHGDWAIALVTGLSLASIAKETVQHYRNCEVR